MTEEEKDKLRQAKADVTDLLARTRFSQASCSVSRPGRRSLSSSICVFSTMK